MKNKNVAATLAFLMGIFGVHRFYLGQRFLGILHLVFFFFAFGLTMEENEAFIMAPALLGFIDAILLFVMPREEFDDKYNRNRLHRYGRHRSWQQEQHRSYNTRQHHRPNPYSRRSPAASATDHKRLGVSLFREYDFEGAVEAFERALDEKFDDPSTHFNLACSYSMLNEAEPSFYHLEKAIEFGFTNLEKIHQHDALSFIRAQPVFADFARNGYRQVDELPSGQQALDPPETDEETDDLLQQIIKLGKLRDKGILTEKEFTKQKKKILGEE